MSKQRYEICEECNRPITLDWCNKCNSKRFQQNFKNWTSGNDDIDKFIQDAQLSTNYYSKVLEWIPYDRFYDIEFIAKGGFGEVYRANWIDGYIHYWDYMNKNWKRVEQNKFVALKSLNNSKNVRLEFINEIMSHYKVSGGYIIRLYGITQDPEAKNYIMVLQYAENGSLRNYLDTNKSYRSWYDKINDLYDIAFGLNTIHGNELIHRDLHIGNILKTYDCYITDMGLCKPADCNDTKKSIYGVLPYIAPEILRGQSYTKASDIYSFGIIMYELISGLPHTMICLDANPLNRPSASESRDILNKWFFEFYNQIELQKQIKEADEFNNNLSTSNSSPSTSLGLSYKTHSEAIYTSSRLLNFNNLPKPKNSDDYYHEQNDNLISKEFLEYISQLKINDDDAEE